MGYTTDFKGSIEVHPPLNEQEIEYLNKFSKTRRMDRTKGPYFIEGTGPYGQGKDDDIINYNTPPSGQPGLWCQWIPTQDGSKIKWSQAEKFYDSLEWIQYLITHFIGDNPQAKAELPFLNQHVLHGVIEAKGEDRSDHWFLVVENNQVKEVAATKAPQIGPLDINLIASLDMNVNADKIHTDVITDEREKSVSLEQESKKIYISKKGRFNL